MSVTSWVRVPDDVAYRTVRRNVAALLADDDGVGDLRVPSCPEWTVRDLVAHLVGNTAAVLGDDPEGMPPADAPLGLLLDVWRRRGEGVEAHLHGRTDDGGTAVLVMDAFTHEVDLCYTVGAPVPTEHVAYEQAFRVLAAGLGQSVRSRGLPALRLVCEGAEWVCGPGEPAVTLAGSRHDVHRALAGRRSRAQLAAMDWSDDPDRWLPAFTWGPFAPPDRPGDVVSDGS